MRPAAVEVHDEETAQPQPQESLGTEPADTEPETAPENEAYGTPTGELKGILFLERPYKFLDSSTSQADDIEYYGDITISTLDPETGVTQAVRSFPVGEYDHNIGGTPAYDYYSSGHYSFDENYERLALQVLMPDNSRHVGWIDQDGTFTDITALITVDMGDFGGTVVHEMPSFGPDNYFYYQSEDGYMRVSLEDLRPESVEQVESIDRLFPDGSVRTYRTFETAYYSSSAMAYGANLGEIDRDFNYHLVPPSWINDSDFVYTSGDTILRHSVLSGEMTELVPDITDRWNYNPVVSPDGTRVAFLSSLRSSSDMSAYVFVVPAEGGAPEKLNTDQSFYCRDYEGHLLEWRD